MCTKESKMNYKFDGSKVYFTSDTHFYHSNIIGFCKRPFKNVEDMNETLIENWNRVVGQDDIVFHLGDFCMGGSHEWTKILNRLNGKIYLILGNHDLKNIRQGYTSRFELTTMQMHIEVDKQKIYLNHCPLLCYGGASGIRGNCSGTCIRANITREKTLHDWICSFRRNMMWEWIIMTLLRSHSRR